MLSIITLSIGLSILILLNSWNIKIRELTTLTILGTFIIICMESPIQNIEMGINSSELIQLVLLIILLIWLIINLIPVSGEVTLIIGTAILGIPLIMSAESILNFYLGIELLSLSSYLLAASNKEDKKSIEAGLKYFILGAIGSGIILFGFSLIYGLTGLSSIDKLLTLENMTNGILTGWIFILVGLLFKLGAAPFHSWVPDIYEGSPMIITTFFGVIPKIGILIGIIRLFYPLTIFGLDKILMIATILSIIIGGLGALYQKSMKRLLGYSAILNIGFMLLGICTQTIEGIEASILYIIIYIITTIGIFSILLLLGKEDINIEDLKGLVNKHKGVSVALSILLFSTAGMPPLAGFLGKYMILQATIETKMYGMTGLIIIMSVISAAYYIRIIQFIYFHKDKTWDNNLYNTKISIGTTISILFTILIMFNPTWLITWIHIGVMKWL